MLKNYKKNINKRFHAAKFIPVQIQGAGIRLESGGRILQKGTFISASTRRGNFDTLIFADTQDS